MPEETLDILISTYRDNLEYKAKDEDLVVAINKAIQESKELKDKMDSVGRRNKLFWAKGTEKDMSRVHPKKAKIINNRIFTDIETCIPIITSEPPEPTIIGQLDNAQRENLSKGLEIAYEVKYKMQQKLQCLVRHWFLNRIGVWKYRWDKDKKFITENVLAKKMGFDKRATEKGNCEFMWEELEDTVENIISKFPKKKKEIQNMFGKEHPKSKLKYLEFWGENGEWVCWKLRDIILDKKKNPNFDYGEKAKETETEYTPSTEGQNIFEKPQFPYILMNVFNLGDETGMYDETSLIEQSASLQEGANQEKQQILDLNEGQKRVWVASGEAISAKQAQDLVDKTGDLMLYLDRKAPVTSIQQVQSGKPDASLFNDVASSLSEIDNTIGMHSTTRGERAQQETLGGRQLLMGSDYGRLDLIVRNVEQAMEEWYNAYLHMLKVYSSEPEVLSNGETTIELTKEQIPSGIMVMVKKGSTLPIDKKTKMANAIELSKAGMIDPATLFEEMGYASVDERVQALYQWLQMTGKIAPQQPQMPQGQAQGQQGDQGGQQLQRLQQIMQSPQFQQLPPEQQKEMVGRARQVVEQIKQGQ